MPARSKKWEPSMRLIRVNGQYVLPRSMVYPAESLGHQQSPMEIIQEWYRICRNMKRTRFKRWNGKEWVAWK